MGPCDPTEFQGVNRCETINAPDKVCGCVTMGPNPVPIDGEERLTIGQIYMKASTYQEEGFLVHIAADDAMMVTVGGICKPQELVASGTGTAQASYLQYSPPSPPPAP